MGMSLGINRGLALNNTGGAAWSPARLLSGASQLAYYDPSDLSTLFQDSAGTTPVTTDGQSVGLVLDKGQGLTLGAENAVSPTPNTTDWTNTTAGCVVTAGFATWTAAASGARVDPASSGIVVGTTYKVEITIDSISAGAIRLTDSLGASTNRPDLSTSGTHVFYITAAVTDIRIRSVGATTTAVVSRLSVKALPGNHLIQSTAGSRPLYKTSGGLHWLQFDGTDDFLVSAANVNPGSVDKAQVFAGVRKLSDTGSQAIAEMSASSTANPGTIFLYVNSGGFPNIAYGSGGTSGRLDAVSPNTLVAPATVISTGLSDIAGDSILLRNNGNQVGSSTGDQGAGNYASHLLYVGRRGGTSLPFNGNLYSLIVRFSAANLDAAVIDQAEAWTAGKTGVTL